MPEFLKLLSVEVAAKIFWQELIRIKPVIEKVETFSAQGRVLAETINADEFLPAFTRSTVDGYAVRANETHGASESMPAYLKRIAEVPMGAEPRFGIGDGESALIHTGGMLPPAADAVVMLEQSSLRNGDLVEIYKAVAVNENVLLKGEDVKPGDLLIPTGTLLRPEEIAGLLALGRVQVNVFARPRVGILSSGDEVVSPNKKVQMGQVRDINTGALAAMVTQTGGIARTYPIVPDDVHLLEETVRLAYAENDVVVITAGSSASARDMTAEVIQRIGAPGILVHGINVRPGKPTILAMCDGKPIVGLPGNPVSALVIARLFVRPLVRKMAGAQVEILEPLIHARLEINLSSQTGRDDYIPAVVKKTDQIWYVRPIFFKSNLIFNLVRANGLIHIPTAANGISAGETVEVLLLQ
jgi:molybdopterin molybdotransferase